MGVVAACDHYAFCYSPTVLCVWDTIHSLGHNLFFESSHSGCIVTAVVFPVCASMCVSVFAFVCVCCMHDDSQFLCVGTVGCLCENSKCALRGGGRRGVEENWVQ